VFKEVIGLLPGWKGKKVTGRSCNKNLWVAIGKFNYIFNPDLSKELVLVKDIEILVALNQSLDGFKVSLRPILLHLHKVVSPNIYSCSYGVLSWISDNREDLLILNDRMTDIVQFCSFNVAVH